MFFFIWRRGKQGTNYEIIDQFRSGEEVTVIEYEADLLNLMDEEEAVKPDPDADYVDDDENYGYVAEDEDDLDFSDEENNEPV